MKKKYRVTSERFDIQEHTIEHFEADDNNNDEEARRKFDKDFRYNAHYSYDWLWLVRIDQEEKTTHIASKG